MPTYMPPAANTTTSSSSNAEPHPRSQSTDPGVDRDGAYGVRSVPIRIHLPDGPVLQDIVAPMNDQGLFFFWRFLAPFFFYMFCRRFLLHTNEQHLF